MTIGTRRTLDEMSKCLPPERQAAIKKRYEELYVIATDGHKVGFLDEVVLTVTAVILSLAVGFLVGWFVWC